MPEECWGDWIGEKWGPIKNVHHKMKEDMWSVSKDEHMEASEEVQVLNARHLPNTDPVDSQ